GIGNIGGVPISGVLDRGARINVDGAADLTKTIDALVRGSNGIRNGGNRYDVGETEDSDGVGMTSNLSTSDFEWNGIESSEAEMELRRARAGTVRARVPSYFSLSPSSSSGSISGSESVMYPSDSAVGDTAAGSGYSSAGNTSSAGDRYSGYSGP
nr:hypothetical protein [Tanacetum cinerariifolium]